jgi:hypothetical protein
MKEELVYPGPPATYDEPTEPTTPLPKRYLESILTLKNPINCP